MKILSAIQTKALDQYTIENEPICSINLMERAAIAFCDKFMQMFPSKDNYIKIFCGLGNNGGDGLAIGRILYESGYKVEIFILEYSDKKSADFIENLARNPQTLPIFYINDENDFPLLSKNDLVIDAIFGSGLSKPLKGFVEAVVQMINSSGAEVIAVDISSGMFMDEHNAETNIRIKAQITISFQLPKIAFMQPENGPFVGEWHIVDIGLNSQFIKEAKTSYFYTESVDSLLRKRQKFSNKGNFGHGLLVAGSFGMMGAAILAARAALRSGLGKLTVLVPKCGYEIMQLAVPEAMVLVDENEKYISESIDYQKYTSIGLGPGLGKSAFTVSFLKDFLKENFLPKVLDADALNMVAEHQLQYLLSPNTIITPHPKEFERLIGKTWNNDFEKLEFARDFAKQYQVIVVLKGAHTAVVLPNGQIHFNSTGNAGMAKGGSGDVLTGMITSLLAQGYFPDHAAIIGAYLHGQAGDIVAANKGQNAIIASDIIEAINF